MHLGYEGYGAIYSITSIDHLQNKETIIMLFSVLKKCCDHERDEI